jgi:3'-5' exoribonuclease
MVLEEVLRPTRSGDRFFYQYTIKTVFGQIKAMMWNAVVDSGNDLAFPHVSDIIEISNFTDQIESHKSIVIQPDGFKRVTKNEIPVAQKSLCEFPKAKAEDMKWAMKVLMDKSIWEKSEHYEFTTACLAKLDKDKLKSCPAATAIHHNYQGGLLVHTAEVLTLCKAVIESTYERYPFVNKDVLYASAILHDIGKVETYHISDMGIAEQLTTEKTIGHIYYGMHLAQIVGQERNIDPQFLMEVMHCIAAHHGTTDWGSIKPVLSHEAGILSRVDYISSRNGMIESRLDDTIKANMVLKNDFTVYGDQYFSSLGMIDYLNKRRPADGELE